MYDLNYLIVNIAIVFIIYLVVRIIYVKKSKLYKLKVYWLRELLMAGLVIYATAMFVLLFCYFYSGFIDKSFVSPIERLEHNIGVNFIPFKSITDFMSDGVNYNIMIENIFGNILLFVPAGFLMALLWQRWRKILNMILFSVFAPVGVEFVQLFIGRSVDVDDVILNFTGMMAGFLLAKFLVRLLPGVHKKYIS